MNKPYRISPHEVLELWLKTTVYHSKKRGRGGGGGLKDNGGGSLITFFPSKGRLIREVRNLTPLAPHTYQKFKGLHSRA